MNKQPCSYLQTDPRWAKLPYRVPGEDATIGGSGCGPTCAAMLIQTLVGKTFTPADACAWSMGRGYKALNQGTYYSYFVPQFAAFGIDCTRVNTVNIYGDANAPAHDAVEQLLRDGWYIIACMGRGLWTSSGHFVVVWWSDGCVYINDPASQRIQRLRGDLDTFRSQVKYYWAIDAREYNREDNDMSYEEFKQHMEQYRKELAEKSVSDWAEELLEEAKSEGITDGTRPQDFATRQEVALMVRAVR